MKNSIKHIFAIIIIFTCSNRICMANEEAEVESLINVDAAVDRAQITIGDKVKYTVTIDYPEEVYVIPPGPGEKIGDLTVVDSGTEGPKKEEGRSLLEEWYTLESFKAGSYIVPAIEIKHKKKGEEVIRVAKTPEIFIEVVSVLDENASDIRDIRPPITLYKNYFRLYMIIAITIGVLGIAGAIVFYLYRRKHREVYHAPEPLPSHETAYNELEELKSLNLISKGLIKEYYYRLSNIARRYVENRFRLMAPERTTDEFLEEMSITNKLEEKHKQLIGDFLEHCDLVKYAKYGPNGKEIEGVFGSAKKLVDETKEVTGPVTAKTLVGQANAKPDGKVAV